MVCRPDYPRVRRILAKTTDADGGELELSAGEKKTLCSKNILKLWLDICLCVL